MPTPYVVDMSPDDRADLLAALRLAQELVRIARPYMPKSIKNRDTYQFCVRDAAINKALFNATSTGEESC